MGRGKSAAKYTCYRVPIEKMPAHGLALIFDDRNVFPVLLMPVRIGVDIAYLELQPPLYQRQQFLDEDLAQVAALATVNLQFIHGGARSV